MTTFDAMPDGLFWALFLTTWFVASIVFGLFVGKLIRWCDTPANRYDTEAERKRRIAHNGFKSRQGIR